MSTSALTAKALASSSIDRHTISNSVTRGTRFKVRVGIALASVPAVVGLSALAATPAEASVTHCGSGSCTIYLSQSETKALGASRIPAVPLPAPIKTVFNVTAKTHIWIAKQYGKQNKCSAFTINARPWATQGYYGYSCNWR